ncbi:hypothetical protein PSTG_19350 [Puccinia striiformis f. sp. tritici PST-78]|uniref:Uncharacterized protein n=1 Tax=Puccinia striiformis f. sp. tritici PST-78 TaxID=1165861 RepID=A0A0L0UKJ7_9BASI|nr:hypothetical protein PSTG_19350 [Puccinia striiformis f. sp. tritici PST-78]
MGLTSLHENLVRNLTITLKKANTVSIRKSLRQKFQYIAQMANVPAEFLVFTAAALLAREVGIDPHKMRYVAFEGGGAVQKHRYPGAGASTGNAPRPLSSHHRPLVAS